jgi:predicted Fe-Mo cluster-binding NifX family protein
MSYKIAIASTDGKVINQHFGKAEKFYIMEVKENEEYELLEVRTQQAPCSKSSHKEEELLQAVNSVADCRYILVSHLGPAAEYALNKKGVTAFVISHYISEAVKKLIQYNSQLERRE